MSVSVIGLDLGTGGAKAAVFRADGVCVAERVVPYETFYPSESRHEQRPEDWWEAVRGSMRLSLAGRTLEMKVSHRRQVHHVGTVEPIAEPAGAVAEFRRPLRPREPLAFFRGMLAPGEDGVPTETPAAAEASAADARPSPRGAPRKADR